MCILIFYLAFLILDTDDAKYRMNNDNNTANIMIIMEIIKMMVIMMLLYFGTKQSLLEAHCTRQL